MRFLLMVMVLVYVLAAVLIVTQLVNPMLEGRPLFPLFRRKLSAVESKIAAVREELDLAERQRVLDDLKSKL